MSSCMTKLEFLPEPNMIFRLGKLPLCCLFCIEFIQALLTLMRVLVVTNDHIRPPITIQNRRNKQTFDTYQYNIDIVPLVLQDYYFVGLIFEYKWKTKQKAQHRKA